MLTREDVLRAEVFLADLRQGLTTATSESQIDVAGLNRVIGINISYPARVLERAPKLDEYPVVASRGTASRPGTGGQALS